MQLTIFSQFSLLVISKNITALVACLLLGVSSFALSADVLSEYKQLTKAGYLLADGQGQPISSSQADAPLIPASTVKVITAWLALSHWSEQHRFKTSFYFDKNTDTLWVKAGGDPFLVSEELEVIAQRLVSFGINKISTIGLETDLFQPDLVVPGATTTDNPYDAVPTALAANFNTVNVQVDNGAVTSAEAQTPLTPLSRQIGSTVTGNIKSRVNTGQSSRLSERYFAELLGELLRQRGVVVGDAITWGVVPGSDWLYEHENSRTLGEVIEGMLKYSTNFIANQLILTLVAEKTSVPADFEQVEQFLSAQLGEAFGWSGFALREGAGLSAENRLSPAQLVELLDAFKQWRHLLPEVQPGVIAKTGTLTGVKTLAGYVSGRAGQHLPFAVLVNESVAADWPAAFVKALVR